MHAGHHCCRCTSVDLRDRRWNKLQDPIQLIPCYHLGRRLVLELVPDVGKTLGAKKFVGHVLRRNAREGWRFLQADRGYFRRRLRSNRLPTTIEACSTQPCEARGACQCDVGQEVASALHDRYGMSPLS